MCSAFRKAKGRSSTSRTAAGATPPPTAALRVGRFGWKAQEPDVIGFSAGAAFNEIGITNMFHPVENAPNGNTGQLAVCDTVPDPEDQPDAQGYHFFDRINDFQRFMTAPPQTPKFGMSGERIFNNIGCANCHVASYTTSNNPNLEDPIRNKAVRPYSDFLLHDMGALNDSIAHDGAGMNEMKTPPLWCLR